MEIGTCPKDHEWTRLSLKIPRMVHGPRDQVLEEGRSR